jgi:MerR family copper efflux transcriptional regulator
MNIGQAARQTGLSSKKIRHYETIGLLKNATRSASGYRVYDENDLHVLRFIKRARSLGFALGQIKTLLSLWQDRKRASKNVKALAEQHINELEARIAELSQMREVLEHLAQNCSGDQRPDCPILSELAAPQQDSCRAAETPRSPRKKPRAINTANQEPR